MTFLDGKRVLVVEDEALIATMIEDILVELGVVVVGPAATVAQGLQLARNEQLDAAILDINIRGEPVDPVAVVLASRGIPVAFATGYGRGIKTVSGAVVIDKPYSKERLLATLVPLLSSGHAG